MSPLLPTILFEFCAAQSCVTRVLRRRCSHLTIRRSGRQAVISFCAARYPWQRTSDNPRGLHGLPMQRRARDDRDYAQGIRETSAASAGPHEKTRGHQSLCRHGLRSTTFIFGGPRISGGVGRPTGGTTKDGLRVPRQHEEPLQRRRRRKTH